MDFKCNLGVSGLREAEDFLKTLEQKVAKKIVRTALKDGAKPILARAKATAPKASGALERSLRIKSGKSRKKTQVTVQVAADGNKKNLFQGKTFYGGFIEYGYEKVPVVRGPRGRFYSAPRGTKPTTKVRGLHFLRRAAEDAATQAIEQFQKRLGTEIAKEKAKPPTVQK